jgi:hypothetical protein
MSYFIVSTLECCDVIAFIELVITHAAYYLAKILRSPIPKWMLYVVFIAKIANVTG